MGHLELPRATRFGDLVLDVRTWGPDDGVPVVLLMVPPCGWRIMIQQRIAGSARHWMVHAAFLRRPNVRASRQLAPMT